MKNACEKLKTIKNRIIKNEKTFLATPKMIAKYLPKYVNALKNSINFRSNNKLDNETNSIGGELL